MWGGVISRRRLLQLPYRARLLLQAQQQLETLVQLAALRIGGVISLFFCLFGTFASCTAGGSSASTTCARSASFLRSLTGSNTKSSIFLVAALILADEVRPFKLVRTLSIMASDVVVDVSLLRSRAVLPMEERMSVLRLLERVADQADGIAATVFLNDGSGCVQRILRLNFFDTLLFFFFFLHCRPLKGRLLAGKSDLSQFIIAQMDTPIGRYDVVTLRGADVLRIELS